jgi:hypothetical protein
LGGAKRRLGGATGILGGATGRLGSATGRNLGVVKGVQLCLYCIITECDLEDHARVREL